MVFWLKLINLNVSTFDFSFWSVLISEAIPLLESEELVFFSGDTYTILHCLEEKEGIPELSDKTDILRLAAARNLSRALMYEAQQM